MALSYGITRHTHTGSSYRPMVDFEAWRVALLRYDDTLVPEKMPYFERHPETDEVFVLLEGQCILFWSEESSVDLSTVKAEAMQPGVVYNVRQGSWHTSAASRDALVLIVENQDTEDENSDFYPLSPEERNQVIRLAQACGWKEDAPHDRI